MDLSAVIFVVLALAWAVYLIPKALQHHDEMASDRLVEGHSERVRILRRKTTPTEVLEVETEVEESTSAPAAPARRGLSRRPRPVLTPAGTAARRRRRVLAVLLCGVVVLAGLAFLGYAPWLFTAVPGAMVLVFLVIARLSVRSAQRPSLAQRRPAPARSEAPASRRQEEPTVFDPSPVEDEVDVALSEEPDAELLADDGSLWDPLPLTLPTYVNKARARRTVRTIELTGMHSSGHDSDDSALAREAETEAPAAAEDDGQQRVAGA